MMITSQNTQVLSYRDLYKGCNKAPGPLAKGLSSHSTQGFNNAAVHTELCEGSNCSPEGQTGLRWENTSSQCRCKCLYIRGDNGISLHRCDRLSFHSVVWVLAPAALCYKIWKMFFHKTITSVLQLLLLLLHIMTKSTAMISWNLDILKTLQQSEVLTYNQCVSQPAVRTAEKSIS